MARRSTAVEPEGTHTMICGRANDLRLLCTLRMKCLIISSATSKSAMTPSRKGRIAWMFPGVRPSISLASSPTARTCFLPRLSAMATTEGSLRTIPRPLTYTSVFAVPRSIAISDENMPTSLENIQFHPSYSDPWVPAQPTRIVPVGGLPEDAGRPSPLQSRTAFGGGRLMRHGTGDRVRIAKEAKRFATQESRCPGWPVCFYPSLANQHKSEIGTRNGSESQLHHWLSHTYR